MHVFIYIYIYIYNYKRFELVTYDVYQCVAAINEVGAGIVLKIESCNNA